MLMCDLLQREVWFCVTSRNENPLGKMSRWNCFLTLSKLSLYPLPIPDDGGSNCFAETTKYIAFRPGLFVKELRYINVTLR